MGEKHALYLLIFELAHDVSRLQFSIAVRGFYYIFFFDEILRYADNKNKLDYIR